MFSLGARLRQPLCASGSSGARDHGCARPCDGATYGGAGDEVGRGRPRVALQRKRTQREARGQDTFWQTACLVHWLAPGEPGAAMAFLERQRPRDATVVAHWLRQLDIAEAQTPEAERSRLTTAPGTAEEHRRLKRAASWLQELGLHRWIDTLNLGQGIAPVTGVVLQEVERRRVSAAAEAPGVHVKAKHRLQCLRRWRRRRAICLARLLPGRRLPPEACARKATASLSGIPSRSAPGGGDAPPPRAGRAAEVGGGCGAPGPKVVPSGGPKIGAT